MLYNVCFTNAVANVIFVLKLMFMVSRRTQHQDVINIKSVASNCLA